MSRQASVHELAELELKEAAANYNEQWPGLGVEFLDEYGRALIGEARRRLGPPREGASVRDPWRKP